VTNRLMTKVGCPPSMWLYTIQYVTHLLNFLASESLNWQVPLQMLWGFTPDSSVFLAFHFCEHVFYASEDNFPSTLPEKLGRIVGFALGVGDALTFQILADDTGELLFRSAIRPRFPGKKDQDRHQPVGDPEILPDKPIEVIRMESDGVHEILSSPVNTLLPDKLSFLLEEDKDGQRMRATIVKKIIEIDEMTNKEIIKFLVEVPDGKMDQLRDYHDLLDKINSQHSIDEDGNTVWKFLKFEAHSGPLTIKDPGYNGSSYNILIRLEDGSCTYEPLTIMAKDDPEMCAQYAIDHNLLNTDGWKEFCCLAKNKKVLQLKVNQIIKQHNHFAPIFMFGVKIPRDPKHARILDQQNQNNK
jgi:hypothetical protein